VLKVLLLATASAALAASQALAAELGVRRPVYRAPAAPAPGFTWTGIYIGANGGCGFDTKRFTANFADSDPGELGSAFRFPSSHGGGCFGGGQIGANYQWSNLVLGVEADASWAPCRAAVTCSKQTRLASRSLVSTART
jgi:outer membrane immunogenic protein